MSPQAPPGTAAPGVAGQQDGPAVGAEQRHDADPMPSLSAAAEQLLIAASVYREPVGLDALLFHVGKHDWAAARVPDGRATPQPADDTRPAAAGPAGPQADPAILAAPLADAGPWMAESGGLIPAPPYQPPANLAEQIGECSTAGLLTVEPAGAGEPDPADRPASVFVPRPAAVQLQRRLAANQRGDEAAAAHRHAADFWLWRVAALQQDRRADVHDLLEARYHLLAADDPRQAEAVTQGICAQLHASGELDQEASLIRDTLVWLPHQSPRRAPWIHELGRVAQMQGDHPAASRRYHQALELFIKLADSAGIADVQYDLGLLAQVTGNYLEAERRTQQALELGLDDAAGMADAAGIYGHIGWEPAGSPAAAPAQSRNHADAGKPAQRGRHGPRPRIAGGRARRDRYDAGPGGLPRRAGRRAGVAGRWQLPAMAAVLALTAGVATLLASPNIMGGRLGQGRRPAVRGGSLGYAAALRRQAATWIAAQVGRDAIIACDPVMCDALQARGLPAGSMLVIRPDAADPLGSDVVVATQAVRAQFRSRLAAVYAPTVIASLGSGSSRIDIRAVAPYGASEYRTALTADLTARRQDGALLLRNPRITVSATSRRQLAAGLADSRVLITLAALAHQRPLYIAALGGSAPGASAGVPLYWAEIAAGGPASGRSPGGRAAGAKRARFVAATLAFLLAQRPPFLVASARPVRLATGQTVVRIDFSAPSPLGLLAGPGTAARLSTRQLPKTR